MLEKCVFQGKLQAARVAHLRSIIEQDNKNELERVLLVGDGDGRFLQALLNSTESLTVDYVDVSPGMVEIAKKRVGCETRVNWHCKPIEAWEGSAYGAIVAHFFLDGFDELKQHQMIELLVAKLDREGLLLVSDFDPNTARWSKLAVLMMQIFFRITAGLPFVSFEKTDNKLKELGCELINEKTWWRNWIYSQIWKKT